MSVIIYDHPLILNDYLSVCLGTDLASIEVEREGDMKKFIGLAVIGHPANKTHYVDAQGNTACGTKAGTKQLIGDSWYDHHINAWLAMKDLVNTYGLSFVCQKCWKNR